MTIYLVNERRLAINRVVLFVVIITLWIVSVAWGLTTQEIANKTFPSVVLLVMEDANGQPVSMGSGFFVKSNTVATNLHVIEGAREGYAKVVGENTIYNISGTVGIDEGMDLALLSVERAKPPSLLLGNSGGVQVGDEVYAVGNPLGLEGIFSKGIVSGVRLVGSETVFQVTAPLSPGSSGGPMVNNQGKVVGVAAAGFKGGQNINFAIPSYYLKALLAKAGPAKPLASFKPSKKQQSIFAGLGERGLKGVTGELLRWKNEDPQSGDYSFSLRNRLRSNVKDIFCLIVFYDWKGRPIDVDAIQYYGLIRAGLAQRVTSSVDGSVQELNTPAGSKRPRTGGVEFRILDFKIVE